MSFEEVETVIQCLLLRHQLQQLFRGLISRPHQLSQVYFSIVFVGLRKMNELLVAIYYPFRLRFH